MNKSEKFDEDLQQIARFAKVLSHPARLAILKYLAETRVCISGDISDFIPLGRTTVSQHLKELKEAGLISGEIDGLKINYCISNSRMKDYIELINDYFCQLSIDDLQCCK
jgi:DNA-binding transcriptional ArsR family regulator